MTKRPGAGVRVLSAYAVLAPHYDEVYAVWRSFLGPAREEILRAYGVERGRVLDVGCGSGWQTLELARTGSRVVAIDPVADFLPPLRRRARREGLEVSVRRGGLPELPVHSGEAFDLAIATFDVLNHLEDHADLAPSLGSIARALVPGGHLLFDLNTPSILASVPDHHRVSHLASGGLSAETGAYDPATGRATIRRDWFLPAARGSRIDSYLRFREEYHEIAWEKRQILAALGQAGLVPRLFADACGWLSFLPPRSRWIVLATRRS